MTTRHPPHRKPDWRLTVRFRHGAEDDLIEYLHSLPSGYRAAAVREAVHLAVQSRVIYDGHFIQGKQRHQPDLRVTVRFHPGEDDEAIAYLQSLPSRKKSAYVRQALRAVLHCRRSGSARTKEVDTHVVTGPL